MLCYAQEKPIASSLTASNPFNSRSFIETATSTSSTSELVEEIGTNGYSFEIYDAGINTEYSEYGSTFFMNKFIMFSSRKLGAFGSGKNDGTDEFTTTLFCTDMDKNGNLDRPLLFSHYINNKDNQASVAFTPDEKKVYFTESSRENHEVYHLYSMEMNPTRLGEWINKKKINFTTSEYSIENPHVTADGKTLYFASNMPGTMGGFDIFSAEINADGTLEKPKPVAGEINTQFDEKYPFTSKSGKHLYFSSTGHRSLGGYDVFVSRIVKGTHVNPRNLGTSLNSRQDDISFIPASKTKGYLTSNRNEGEGGFDIYKTTLHLIAQTLSGKVLDINSETPLQNSLVKLYDQEGIEVGTFTTDEKGSFKFGVEPYEIYTLEAIREGFEPQKISVDIYNGNQAKFQRNILLAPTKAKIVEKEDKTVIEVENVYFNFDKDVIKPESLSTLNKVADLLKEFPEIKLAIGAHTDAQGSASYNLKLSERRAASTMKYLISQGIDASRLTSKGYGETQPEVNCETCSEEDHQKNRRIEFVIVNPQE